MRLTKTMTLTLAAAVFCGCARTERTEAPSQPLPATDWVASYRASIEQASPGSIVGVVNAVLPADNLASITDVPAGALQPKETMTFIDSEGNPLVVGTIVTVSEFGNVHVKYENPVEGRRAPQVGDAAVWLKK